MAFAAGVYTLPAGNPVVTATTISSSWANSTLSDIATALSTCVLKDGTQTLTANIPMGGFKLTGLAVGSAAADSVRMDQLQNQTTSYLTGTAGTNTITASGSPTVTALTAGQRFVLIPANTNTGATTLQINSTAATNIFWNNAALVGGEIRQNVPIEVMYDGTQYQLLASAAMANTYAIPDNAFRLQAAGDRTKMFVVGVTGVGTGTTVTMNSPATGGSTFVGDTLNQTLTNKTLTSPTLNTLITGSAVAVKADLSGGTSTNLMVSPGQMVNARSSAKAWGSVSTPTTVQQSYPAGATVTNPVSGAYVVTFATTMATNTYDVAMTTLDFSQTIVAQVSGRTTTTIGFLFNTVAAVPTAAAPAGFTYTIFGDN